MEAIQLSRHEAKQKWLKEADLHTISIENPQRVSNGLELQRKQYELRVKPILKEYD